MKTVAVIVKLFVAVVWYLLCWPVINLYRGVTTIWKRIFDFKKPVQLETANTIAPTTRYKKPKSIMHGIRLKNRSIKAAKLRESRKQRRFNLEHGF